MNAPPLPTVKRPLVRRAALAVGGVAAVGALVVFGGVYVARERIAVRLAQQWLGEHGAAGSAVEVQGLSLSGFTAKVRIGDPKDPDLTVDQMTVDYAVSGPWTGEALAVHTRAVRLVRPHLKARLIDGKLTFGALDGVIKAIAQLPPTKDPLPDVTLEDADARLVTDGGTVRMHGAGSLRAGALTALQGQVDPFRLALGGARIDSAGGAFSIESYGGRLKSRADFGPGAYAAAGLAANAGHVKMSAEAPYPGGSKTWAGPAQMALEATGVAGRVGPSSVKDGALKADFEGEMDAAAARQTLNGVIRASGQAASASGPGLAARSAAGQATLTQVSLVHDARGVDARAAAQARVTAAAVDTAAAAFTGVSTTLRSNEVRLASIGATQSLAGMIDGAAQARGHATGPGGDAPYAGAIRAGLRDFAVSAPHFRVDMGQSGVSVGLVSPLTLAAASGARVTVSGHARAAGNTLGGSATLVSSGGGLPALTLQANNAVVARGGVTADIAARGILDAAPAKGVHFRLSGRVNQAGGGTRFDLAGCAPITVERLALDPNPITAVSARLCPAGGPLLAANGSTWQARGRFEALQGDMGGMFANVRSGAGRFDATGAATGLLTAALVLDHAAINDTANPLRFAPLDGAGKLALARGVADGAFTLGTPKGRALAVIALRHDVKSGVGRADIDAGHLVFTPGVLQPVDLTPLALVAKNADGPIRFTGWFAWAPKVDLSSGGEAVATNFKFSSPLGPVTGLNADIRFTSLLPLVTAPDQTVSVDQIQAVLPVSALAANFGLGSEHLILNTATGSMAKGRIRLEPMQMEFGPNATFKGAVVFDHVNLGDILSATNLSDTVKADAVVDGRIPFEVGPNGVKIDQGHLAAVGPGRISLSRQALSGVASNAPATAVVSKGAAVAGQVNFAQDLAYQAMENLAFDSMDAAINSIAHDRLGILFHIKGRHDPPTRQKATIALSDIIGGHALDKPFNLPSDTKIDLTLDTSLNFGDLVKALGQAWRDSLNAGRSPRSAPVQGSPAK